jgi:hypothetical protein
MKSEMLAALSRLFDAEAGASNNRSEQRRYQSISGQLYGKAQAQRRRDIVELLMETP